MTTVVARELARALANPWVGVGHRDIHHGRGAEPRHGDLAGDICR